MNKDSFIFSENLDFQKKALNRFVKYAKINSQSDGEKADNGVFPSTPQQKEFAKLLVEELKTLGVEASIKNECYVYTFIAGTGSKQNEESICLLAHIDTSDEVSGKDVNPQIFYDYDGKEITLSNNVVHSIESDQNLKLAAENKETIITTDGSTLLGADDKAGITIIMSVLEFLKENPQIEHAPFEIIFSPDEETGHGMDKVPLESIKSKMAYTLDGGHIGEFECECFNAWAAKITFTGRACHTGTAKSGKMVNASTMVSNFVARLPRDKAPETTENYQGFIAPMEIKSSIETATVELLLRSFTIEEIEEEKEIITSIANEVSNEFGGAVDICFKQQYLNMKEKINENPKVIEKLEKAFELAKVEPVKTPIRGGTDGSRLTELGIPTPNIFTGGHNFHSRKEWLSLNQMVKSAEIVFNLLSK